MTDAEALLWFVFFVGCCGVAVYLIMDVVNNGGGR